jgi:hypothetical protein
VDLPPLRGAVVNAEQTVRAAFEVLSQNPDRPLSEKMRLLEQEVRPLSVRIAEALRRRLIALPVVLLAVVGCGAPEPDAELCGLTLSPDAALFEETEAAAARWSAATGCDIRVGAGGVPVLAQARVFVVPDAEGARVADTDPDGTATEACGAAAGHRRQLDGWTVYVATSPRVFCPTAHGALPHELGHVLAASGGHAESGLMRNSATVDPIDEASLAFVCGAFPCATFAPETK